MEKVKQLGNTALFIDTGNGSLKWAECDARLEVVEDVKTLAMPEKGVEYKVKACRAALVICGKMIPVYGKKIDVELLKKIKTFSVSFEPLKAVFGETISSVGGFFDITPVEIDLNGEWKFDVTKHIKEIGGLFPDLVFE